MVENLIIYTTIPLYKYGMYHNSPPTMNQGECGTCTTTVGGVKIRACIGKVPPAPRLKSLIEKGLVVTVDNAR